MELFQAACSAGHSCNKGACKLVQLDNTGFLPAWQQITTLCRNNGGPQRVLTSFGRGDPWAFCLNLIFLCLIHCSIATAVTGWAYFCSWSKQVGISSSHLVQVVFSFRTSHNKRHFLKWESNQHGKSLKHESYDSSLNFTSASLGNRWKHYRRTTYPQVPVQEDVVFYCNMTNLSMTKKPCLVRVWFNMQSLLL